MKRFGPLDPDPDKKNLILRIHIVSFQIDLIRIGSSGPLHPDWEFVAS